MALQGPKIDVKELSVEVLTDEVTKLLRLESDELYSTLGGQLLAYAPPSRVAGIVSFLSAIRSASEEKALYETLPLTPALTDWGKGVRVIYEELKQDGIRYVNEIAGELRKAVCVPDILSLSDQLSLSTIQIVLMVVGAVLRLPRELDPISATVTGILLKRGLRNFCRPDTDSKDPLP
jgi:hypothetical protein